MPLADGELGQSERLIAAEGAKRLLADDVLNAWLTELTKHATERAILLPDAAEREAERQTVLAIGRLRAMLEVAASLPEQEKADRERAKSFE